MKTLTIYNYIKNLLLFFLFLNTSIFSQNDFTRTATVSRDSWVVKQIYPDETYSFDDGSYTYGTYKFASGTKDIYNSIYDITLPTDLPDNYYVKSVSLNYTGNSPHRPFFILGYVSNYSSSYTREEKWNLVEKC